VYALEDFPIYVSKHDEMCHRGTPCNNTDSSGLIVR
jgi:hypothetical protein